MTVRVGINGFGRIGRNFFRAVEARFYAALRRLHREPEALGELLALWSQGDDVSTMNARGGVERGQVAVRERWTWWASQWIAFAIGAISI